MKISSVEDIISNSSPQFIEKLLVDTKNRINFVTFPTINKVWLIRRPHSQVYRLELNQCNSEYFYIFIKFPIVNPKNRQVAISRLEKEYEIMAFLSKDNDLNQHGVAVPLALYPELPALVTIGVQGKTLGELYVKNLRLTGIFSKKNSIKRNVQLCAQWLNKFQSNTFQGNQIYQYEDDIKYIEQRLIVLKTQEPEYYTSVLIEKTIKKISSMYSELYHRKHPIVGRHNDFTSHNIITTENGVKVIDFTMFDHGSITDDACRFWFELEMLKLDPTYNSQAVTDLQKVFLNSYQSLDSNDPLFVLACIRHVVLKLVEALGQNRGWGFNSWYWRRVERTCRDRLSEIK